MELKRIISAFNTFDAPRLALLKGNQEINAQDMLERCRNMALLFSEPDNLKQVLAAANISADLKRNAIMTTALAAFRRKIVTLGIFSTRFNSVPLEGTNKVVVPYYPLHTTASNDFVDGTGYQFNHDSDSEDKEVTVNKRKYQPFNYYSHNLWRQPGFDTVKLMVQRTDQLAIDVWTDVLSLVTAADFGAPISSESSDAFDSDDVLDIEGEVDELEWPDVGRSMLLDTAYHTSLQKDPALKHADQSGSTDALREGSTGRVGRFDIYPCSRVPANGENLRGLVCLPPAILVATSPIMPGPGVRKNLVSYDVVIDEPTGVAFEYRHWGSADQDEEREVVEVNYGREKGQTEGLKRIVAP